MPKARQGVIVNSSIRTRLRRWCFTRGALVTQMKSNVPLERLNFWWKILQFVMKVKDLSTGLW